MCVCERVCVQIMGQTIARMSENKSEHTIVSVSIFLVFLLCKSLRTFGGLTSRVEIPIFS